MQNLFEFNNVVAVLLAYFIGSIPSAIWVSKWFFGIDVRDYGSNNAGATNTFRVIGRVAGFIVLFFDILKGWISVKLLTTLIFYDPNSKEINTIKPEGGVWKSFVINDNLFWGQDRLEYALDELNN